MRRNTLACIAVLILTFPPVAAAALSVTDDLAIADRYWGPHPCAGQVQVIEDPGLPGRGFAEQAEHGVTGVPGAWQLVACIVTIAPGLDPVTQCQVIVHGVGHLVYGPGHDGPMAPENLNPVECQPPPVPPRKALIASIKQNLPAPAGPWRVNCTRTSRRMTCWARSPHARFIRRYQASIWPSGSFSWGQ
jgi:hypothetical protein